MRPESLPLQPFVAAIHHHRNAPSNALERILPGGRIHLMVNLHEDELRTYSGQSCETITRTRGAALEGPRSKAAVIDTRLQRDIVIAHFRFGGASAFFKPLNETGGKIVGLDDIWGPEDACRLRERLLEASSTQAKVQVVEDTLLDHLSASQPPDPAMKFAARALDHGLPVKEVTSRLGLLPKTFVRRFVQATGLTPKRFARLRRFGRVIKSVASRPQVDWSALAAEHGYSDQSHLIHEFREMAGITPRDYRPKSLFERNHVPV